MGAPYGQREAERVFLTHGLCKRECGPEQQLMPPPTFTSPDSHKGNYILNFLYLDPGRVKGEALSSVTFALGWGRAAGVSGPDHFLFLRQATPATACSQFALSASTIRRPRQTSLLLKPSMAPQSPGLGPDLSRPLGHTGHLASGTICLSPTVRAQSRHAQTHPSPVCSTLPLYPC